MIRRVSPDFLPRTPIADLALPEPFGLKAGSEASGCVVLVCSPGFLPAMCPVSSSDSASRACEILSVIFMHSNTPACRRGHSTGRTDNVFLTFRPSPVGARQSCKLCAALLEMAVDCVATISRAEDVGVQVIHGLRHGPRSRIACRNPDRLSSPSRRPTFLTFPK
jgi:hypothetical protein